MGVMRRAGRTYLRVHREFGFNMSSSRSAFGRSRLRTGIAVLAAALTLPAAAASASTISGVAFKDVNRDGVQQLDESPLVDQRIYVRTDAGLVVGSARTDGMGSYVVSGLADGSYIVEYDATDWEALVKDWVPSTTGGSLRPRMYVTVPDPGRADFGWRPIVRSDTLGSPISSATGPNGLEVESYTDAVTAQTILDATTPYLVGDEAPTITIRFGYGTATGGMTTTSYGKVDGRFANYSARMWIPYVSFAKRGDQILAHEYGHAWAGYFSTMVGQDDTLASYVRARGLEGDTRLNTSYAWTVGEMIAEDYRELFGSENAKAADQINREIPLAKDVPGLEDFLRTTFRQPPPAPAPDPQPAPEPTPAPALAIASVAISPAPVTRSGTVTWTQSEPATDTVTITKGGTLVRTLLSATPLAADGNSVAWDRKDARGRKVAAGTYSAVVVATAADGRTSTKSIDFVVK